MEQVYTGGLREWEGHFLHHQGPSGGLPVDVLGNPTLFSQGLSFSYKKPTSRRWEGALVGHTPAIWLGLSLCWAPSNLVLPWFPRHNTVLSPLWRIHVHYLSRASLLCYFSAIISLSWQWLWTQFAMHLVPINTPTFIWHIKIKTVHSIINSFLPPLSAKKSFIPFSCGT